MDENADDPGGETQTCISGAVRTAEVVASFEDEIAAGGLFDAPWYARQYALQFVGPEEALREFLTVGARAGRNPNALFDSGFYRSRYALPADDHLPPFLHYLHIGAKKSYWPHPLVDPAWVAGQMKIKGLSGSVMSAVLHKCTAHELDPHPCFSVRFYLVRNPDVAQAGVNPVLHYLRNGERERRLPHPLFWPDWFLRNAGPAASQDGLLVQYLADPAFYRCEPSPFFSGADYLDRHADVKEARFNPLYHYLRYWRAELRSPNERLDFAWAKRAYEREIRATRLDPLGFMVAHQNGYVYANADKEPIGFSTRDFETEAAQSYRRNFPGVLLSGRRRTILFASHNLRLQGAQTSLFELACGISARPDFDVEIIAPGDGAIKSRYKAAGLPVHEYRLPNHGLADECEYSALLRRFEAFILERKPGLVHGNTVQSYHALAVAARHGIPTVWNIRESEEPTSHTEPLHAGARALFLEAMASVSHFVFVAAATRDLWLARFPAIKASVIPNGVDHARITPNYRNINRASARALYGIAGNETVILSVGTWTPRKGQQDLVQALQRIDRRLWPRLRVVMIGANGEPFSEELRDEIAACPAALRARIDVYAETRSLAERARILAAYAAADIFAFTSRIESYPRVLNEAMYYGLAIVSTPCFGVVEQIQPGVSGLFYQAGDAAALGDALRRMVASPELRASLGQAARRRALETLVQYAGMVDSYADVYRKLFAERAGVTG